MEPTKVGLSLSFCVRDILDGKVAIEDVAFISANTKCSLLEHWNGVLESYCNIYWRTNPNEGERIARHFINAGLIIQPRLEDRYLDISSIREYWIDVSAYNKFAKEKSRPRSAF